MYQELYKNFSLFYKDIRKRLLFSIDRVRCVFVRKQRIYLAISSKLEEMRYNTFNNKEPDTLDWIEQNLKAGDVFYDIGANIGQYSIYAAKVSPDSKILAFEPESQNFSRLCKNIVLNQLNNIMPICTPLSDSDRFGNFYVSHMSNGCSYHSFGEKSSLVENDSALIQGAFSMSIDSLVSKHGLPFPNLIKIDVDGIEPLVLNGAKAILSDQKLRSIIIEVTGDTEAKTHIESILNDSGFVCTSKSNWKIFNGEGLVQNLIFHKKN